MPNAPAAVQIAIRIFDGHNLIVATASANGWSNQYLRMAAGIIGRSAISVAGEDFTPR